MTIEPIKFIGDLIEVHYLVPPLLEKKPGPPDGFTWRGERYEIVQVLSEWHDYRRTGRMARNMSPKHSKSAERRGSWGVGKDYFRVLTSDGRIFDIYYDRAPQDVQRRKGAWYLDRESIQKD